MRSFKEYITEAGMHLYRFDPPDTTPEVHTYATNRNRTVSVNVETGSEDVDPGLKDRITGLFAGQYHHALPYAVPRNVRWIVTGKKTKDENPTIHFSIDDKEAIELYRPILSKYNVRQGFERLSGEHFKETEKAPTPISQTTIVDNPLTLIEKHYNIKFVKNLDDLKQQLNDNNIKHTAQGTFPPPQA